MSDELRDRIAGVLDENFNPDRYPIMAEMFRDYAQAVIDELGLTVEKRIDIPGRRGINPARRVVGKWEDNDDDMG